MQRIVDGLNDQEKKNARSEDQPQNVMTTYAKCNVSHHIKKKPSTGITVDLHPFGFIGFSSIYHSQDLISSLSIE
eukprot:scaffold19132_cov93-Cylindrotheca_fusiformis.AAC.1